MKMEPYISDDNVKLAKPIWLNPLYLRLTTAFSTLIYLSIWFATATGFAQSIHGLDKALFIFFGIVIVMLIWLSCQSVTIYENYIKQQYFFGLAGSHRYDLHNLSELTCYRDTKERMNCLVLGFNGDRLSLSSGFVNLQQAFDYIHAKCPHIQVRYKVRNPD